MRTINPIIITLTLLLTLLLTGCGSPSSDIIEGAVKEQLSADFGFSPGEIVDLDITNEYTEEVEGQTVYVYDYELLVKYSADTRAFLTNEEEGVHTGSVSIVKRGDVWYRLKS